MSRFSPTNMNWTDIRRSIFAGLCGTIAHWLLMLTKIQSGVLPEFQPYDDLQRLLSSITGTSVPPIFAWLLSFVNGALVWGSLFGKLYPILPGRQP